MKSKLNIVFYIIIAILTIIAGLEGIYIFEHQDKTVEKEKIKYVGKNFLKENISYTKNEDLSLDAQIYKDDNMLLVTGKTGEKPIVNSKIFIEFYDVNEELVKKEECSIGILAANEKYVCLMSLPSISNDVYAGKILLSSEVNYFETDTSLYDKKLLNFTSSKSNNDETKVTTLTFESENPYENLHYFDGYVLVYKNNKALDAIYFSKDGSNLENGKITFSVLTGPSFEDNELKFMDYDNLEVVINNLY